MIYLCIFTIVNRNKYCGVMKLADMPSCLEGGDFGTNPWTNHSVKVRLLLLQQQKKRQAPRACLFLYTFIMSTITF